MGITKQGSRTRRLMLAGVLAALAVAVIAGSALAAALVKNGSFERDSNGDGIPNGWTGGSLTPADKRVCNQSYAGACSFKMVGDGDYKYLYQEITISGLALDEFTLSARVKGKDLDIGTGLARVRMAIHNTSGGYTNYEFALSEGTSPWNLYQVVGSASGDYDSIFIYLELIADSGKVWFDKVKLVAVP